MKPNRHLSPSGTDDYLLFFFAICAIGFSQSIVDSTFNNYLDETFHISNMARTVLELPRELPGLLVILFSGLLFFLCNRRLAAISQLLAGIGILSIAFLSSNFSLMLVWLFIFSTGQHLFMPLMNDIGMELAGPQRMGTVLGQLQGAMNLASIAGFLFIFIGFRFFKLGFVASFLIAALFYLLSAYLLFRMRKNRPVSFVQKFRLRKEYGMFYWLSILFGTRKQIFLTFAPWVMVTVFEQKTQTIAFLLLAGGVIGIFFKPWLGQLIDKVGEKTILISEAIVLIFVCLGYGFAGNLFSKDIALAIIFACYILDQLMMSVNMARSTYLRKIALTPEDVTSTLTMGVSIDHVFSISVALIGGLLWQTLNYQVIFILGAGIALLSLFSSMRLRIPQERGVGVKRES